VAAVGGGGSGSKTEDWLDLLQTPEPDMFGTRARSASDAAVLRRKGHLKEQDKFIQFLLEMHQTHTSLEVRGPRSKRCRIVQCNALLCIGCTSRDRTAGAGLHLPAPAGAPPALLHVRACRQSTD
jgi:hypothetical protein